MNHSKTYFKREGNIFRKSHPECIRNQNDIARLYSPAFFKNALAVNEVYGFEKPHIWPVNKYAFGDEDYHPAAVIGSTSSMTSGTNSFDSIDIAGSFAETSSPPSHQFLQEIIPPNPANSEAEIILLLNRDRFELQPFFTPIVDSHSYKVSKDACAAEPELDVLAFSPHQIQLRRLRKVTPCCQKLK